MTEQGVWEAWPKCCSCGRRRQTVCPACGQAGNRFRLADFQGVEAPRVNSRQPSAGAHESPIEVAVLFVCARCDEAFVPRYYRICPACGQDAGEGIELQSEGRRYITSRVLLVLYGLLALILIVLSYFWWLFA